MAWLTEWFGATQQWLFETLVEPLMFFAGLGNLVEDAFEGVGWVMVGLLEICAIVLVIGTLQRLRPVEPITNRSAVRTDVLYTLIHRLGLFRLCAFFALDPLFDYLSGQLHVMRVSAHHLDNVWPGITDLPWVSLVMYLIVADFVGYWVHRGQHSFRWWWSLHSVHHSQRQMTMWTDNRNHLLDDVIQSCIAVFVAQMIGVAPGQFVAATALTQLMQNLQHANVRMSYGYWGERLCVSPGFHRLHHGIGFDRFNFGILLPWWDKLFRTANFSSQCHATGIDDQVVPGENGLRDYGEGLVSQQWQGLLRMIGRA